MDIRGYMVSYSAHITPLSPHGVVHPLIVAATVEGYGLNEIVILNVSSYRLGYSFDVALKQPRHIHHPNINSQSPIPAVIDGFLFVIKPAPDGSGVL